MIVLRAWESGQAAAGSVRLAPMSGGTSRTVQSVQTFLRLRWRYWSATTAATMMMPLTISW